MWFSTFPNSICWRHYPFPIQNYIKTNKYLGINLTKEVKNLYFENYKTLIKKIEEDKTSGKIYSTVFMDQKNYCC